MSKPPPNNNPDFIVDLQNPAAQHLNERADASGLRGRKWLAVTYKCCQTYGRLYLNEAGTLYLGFCPKCGKAVRARVGEGGTAARFFVAE